MSKRTSLATSTFAWAFLSFLGSMACASAQTSDGEPASEAIESWQDMRFGMFIHWGPISLKGTEIGWSRGKQVPREEYDALYQEFDPVEFDAEEWARTAKDAGMKYMILTSKHHDGFCLWDTQQTDYDIMRSPFGRDVIAELSAACAKEGIAFGLYYSILDWYQPDYNTAGTYGGPGYPFRPGQKPSMDRYQDYVHAQLDELVNGYGPLFTIWFDGEWEEPWTYERGVRLAEYCRALDPDMLINNRVGKARQGMAGTTKQDSGNPGDYDTPEQRIGTYNDERPWETCMTICTQWAWKPDDAMKSREECIRTLLRTAGGDGNLLFNVGPMPDGRIEPRQAERLREMGAWLEKYGDGVYGTRGGPFEPGEWGASTRRDDKIHLFVMSWQVDDRLVLPAIGRKVTGCRTLSGGRAILEQSDAGLEIALPEADRAEIATVIELTLDGAASTIDPVDVPDPAKAYMHAPPEAIESWKDKRFGMFVHWGPVSLKGTEIGWSRKGPRRGRARGGTGSIPMEEYDNLYKQFDPVEFDADEWVKIAQDAGMQYLVFTSKHHDGFSNFDSAHTDYDITNPDSPYGKDICKQLADACHRHGLGLGWYYSPRDWYHPDFATERHDRYLEFYMGQLRELCTDYGELDILWFDGLDSPRELWKDIPEQSYVMIRKLQPDIVLNNRGGLPGDFDTPEQRIGGFNRERPWETCMTICRQWAWKPNDEMKSFEQCIRTLVSTAGGDGNLLFNVGPMPDGRIEPRQVERLAEMGAWLREHGESIYETRGGPFYPGAWGASTHRGKTVYLHVFDWGDGELVLPGLNRKIVSSAVQGGGESTVVQTDKVITISVPEADRDPVDTVVVLTLDGPVAEMAKLKHAPTAFDLGLHGKWLSEGATYATSSRAAQWSTHEKHLLTDEDYPGEWSFHTEQEKDPYITIDLGASKLVRGIEIVNRRKSLQERAAGLTVWLSEEGEAWREAWKAGGVEDRWDVVLGTPGARARYVKIGLHSDEGQYLHLYRVRVFGDE